MTVVATLGTAMYSFVSTSNLNQIGSMSDTKAYYLAESGGHYAIKQLIAIDSGDATARNTLLNTLSAGYYSITNAGQFRLQGFTYAATPGFHEYRFTAKGSPLDGLASREINYIIKVPNAAGVSIPFTGSGGNLDPNNWNTSGDAVLNNSANLVELDGDHGGTQISLDWTKTNSTLPNLLDVWNDSNGLLTYEIQVKVKLYNDHGHNNNNDVMAGISFRLNTGNASGISDDTLYGLSYLWCGDDDNLGTGFGSDFCSTSNKTYIVLWKQTSNSTNTEKTVIGKQLASSVSSNLVNSDGELKEWATLVVRVQEQINPTSLNRENLIYAFAGYPSSNPSSNQKGTIGWDYSKFSAVKWSSIVSPAKDCSGIKTCVSDSTFTTSNFGTQPQDEIGLHAFGNAKSEVADLAVRFNFNGGTPTTY
jgi:hypothetical protein